MTSVVRLLERTIKNIIQRRNSQNIGIEFGIYETPIIYLRVDNPLDQGVNGPWWKEGYSWVGPSCKIEDLDGIIENKKYETEDELAYLNHKAKYLFEPNEHGYKVLSRNLLSYLKQ